MNCTLTPFYVNGTMYLHSGIGVYAITRTNKLNGAPMEYTHIGNGVTHTQCRQVALAHQAIAARQEAMQDAIREA